MISIPDLPNIRARLIDYFAHRNSVLIYKSSSTVDQIGFDTNGALSAVENEIVFWQGQVNSARTTDR